MSSLFNQIFQLQKDWDLQLRLALHQYQFYLYELTYQHWITYILEIDFMIDYNLIYSLV